MKIKNLSYLRGLPEFGQKLAEALTSIGAAHDTITEQVNGNSDGNPLPPPSINSLNVKAENGFAHVSVVDNNDIYRGIRYYVEHADNPQFTNPQIVPMQDSRNTVVPIGNSARYFRAYSAYSPSSPSAPVYHGGSSGPVPVFGGGPFGPPPWQESQGSGTGPSGNNAGLSGPGTTPFRSATGRPPIRGTVALAQGGGPGIAAASGSESVPVPTYGGGSGSGGGGAVTNPPIFDTYANWTLANYDPAKYRPGQQFFITDWGNVQYIVRDLSGTYTWCYQDGTYTVTQGDIAGLTGFDGGALGANDYGLALWVSDYFHALEWTGSAWISTDGGGGGELSLKSAVPAYAMSAGVDGMWKLLDGTGDDCTNPVGVGNPITYMKEDGTLGTHTAWADIATVGNEAFPLAASGFDALRHATAGQSTDPNVANTTVQAGVGVLVASAGHTHNYTPTDYPVPFMGFKPYMRR